MHAAQARLALDRRVVRYAVVGVAGTLVDLVMLTLLVEVAALPLLVANACSFSAAVATTYTGNRLWTYADRRQLPRRQTGPLFLVAALVGLGLNEVGLYLLAEEAGFHYLLAKLAMVLVVFVWNYRFNTLITFRSRR